MALMWDWNEKVGTMTFEQRYDGVRRITCNLYKGNAYLIAVNEYKAEGQDRYELATFFLDKKHMEQAFGIKRGRFTENPYDTPEESIMAISLDKGKLGLNQTMEIVETFAKTFKTINIDIYTSESQG